MVSKYLSVIIPVHNEEENIAPLHESLQRVLQSLHLSYEVIYVDDGSTDKTFSHLRQLSLQDQYVQIVRLSKKFGQTAAISAGVASSSGVVLVFMDGDLQNDPFDIPRLLKKLDEGYDVVSGWRKQRDDMLLSRKVPSWLANLLISRVTGVQLHDYGCTLKAYRRSVFEHLQLYGEMHRFIPAYAVHSGATIAEIEVAHHARRFGVSKYGISRTGRVLLDLMTLKFRGSFSTTPAYAFGIPGLCGLASGGILSLFVLARKLLPPRVRAHRNPLLPLSIFSLAFGIQCILMGLLAELLMRTYYETQHKAPYVVKEVIPQRQGMVEESGEGIRGDRRMSAAVREI